MSARATFEMAYFGGNNFMKESIELLESQGLGGVDPQKNKSNLKQNKRKIT